MAPSQTITDIFALTAELGDLRQHVENNQERLTEARLQRAARLGIEERHYQAAKVQRERAEQEKEEAAKKEKEVEKISGTPTLAPAPAKRPVSSPAGVRWADQAESGIMKLVKAASFDVECGMYKAAEKKKKKKEEEEEEKKESDGSAAPEKENDVAPTVRLRWDDVELRTLSSEQLMWRAALNKWDHRRLRRRAHHRHEEQPPLATSHLHWEDWEDVCGGYRLIAAARLEVEHAMYNASRRRIT